MASVNQTIHDEIVAHGAALDQHGNEVIDRMVGLLRAGDERLLAGLARALASPPPFRLADLDARLASIGPENEAPYRAIHAALLTEIRSLVDYEIQFQTALLRRAIPAEVLESNPLVTVSSEIISARVLQETFQDGTLEDWLEGAIQNRQKAIRDEVRRRSAAEETSDQIIADLGQRLLSDPDRFLEGARRGLASIVRTLLALVVSLVCTIFYDANSSLIRALQWISVLDNRTTPWCRARAGRCYTLGDHEPIGHAIPWFTGPGRLHFCCRSKAAPVFKSADELAGGAWMSPATRRRMDGRIPPVLTFAEWLAEQPAERQDEVLGRTRGRLYREGGLGAETMYTNSGEFLTLEQLRARDAAAFERAGL